MRVRNISAALMCLIVSSLSALAQASPNGNLYSVARIQVKPERLGDFIENEKLFAAAAKKGGQTWRHVYRGASGNTFAFLIISPVANYAALDSPSPTSKGMPDLERARLQDRNNQCIESVRLTYERSVESLRIGEPGTSPHKISRVTTVRVNPGMEEEWMAMMTHDNIPALKEAGVKRYRVRRIEYGGNRSDFSLTMSGDTMAELDGDSPLRKGLGEAGFKAWSAKASKLSAGVDYALYRYVPDSSFDAPTAVQ